MQMDSIRIRPFEDREDNYLLMYNWCTKEYIYQWFEQRELSLEEITEKYKKKLSQKAQNLFFIYLNDKPIGYAQIYKYSGEKIDLLKSFESVYEFDVFIGEERFLSKGLGIAAVKIICHHIFQDYNADCVILQVFEDNKRALNCYVKAGFKLLDKYNGQDTLGNPKTLYRLYIANDMLSWPKAFPHVALAQKLEKGAL